MKTRLITAAAAVALLGVAIPATASAAVRTGSVQDPEGDASALSGPVLDIKSVAVRYDDAAGTLRVTWTYFNDVLADYDRSASGPGGIFEAKDAPADNRPYDMASIQWSGHKDWNDSWSVGASLSLAGNSGSLPGTVTISDDGHVVTSEFADSRLAGHDWQHSRSSTVWSGDGHNEFWWDGYAAKPPVSPPIGAGPIGPTGPTPPPASGAGANANQGMTINGGALYTNDPEVTLSVIAPDWAKTLRVANDGGFRAATTFSAGNAIRWRLAESGPERLPKTVYLRFGSEAQTFTDDIILDQTKPTVSSATVDAPEATATSTAVAYATASKNRTYGVRIRAKDATSGVAKLQFASGNRRHPSALRKFERISRYRGIRAPKLVRVQDRAGNFSSWRSIR